MQHLKNLFFIFLSAWAILSGCNCKKNIPSPDAEIKLRMRQTVDGKLLTLGSMQYTNASGNLYEVNVLKYYLSNFEFQNQNGVKTNLPAYLIFDGKDQISAVEVLGKLKNDTYTQLTIHLGVDSVRNHTGTQDGALDPMHGMFWVWSSGYIFFKHEGTFRNASGANQALRFHLGTDTAYTPIEIPLNLEVKGVAKTITMEFNLNEVYTNPFNINFDYNNDNQSTSPADGLWVSTMRTNIKSAFTVKSIE